MKKYMYQHSDFYLLLAHGLHDCRAYEEAFHGEPNTVLAMASLASGRLKPEEAYQYLTSVGINYVVVGLSSKARAQETFGAIRKYILGERNVEEI